MTEQFLWKEFGIFGPITTVKLLGSITDEDKIRNINYASINFAERSAAEEAKRKMNGTTLGFTIINLTETGHDFFSYEIIIRWGIPGKPKTQPPEKFVKKTLTPMTIKVNFKSGHSCDTKNQINTQEKTTVSQPSTSQNLTKPSQVL